MTTFLNFPRLTTPALCAESPNPDQWHPPSGGEGAQIAAGAKVVCRRCPSLDECLCHNAADRAKRARNAS